MFSISLLHATPQSKWSAGYQNIQDAVIVGFNLGIGSGERATNGFTGDFQVSTPQPNPIYSWSWNFNL